MNSSMVDRNTFLENLRLSKLLTGQQLRTIVERLAYVQSAREIAKALASWKLLTKFQARMLLAGRNSGFFLGPYRILDVLGQGGMGRVYKALHQTMNRVVALKILAPQMVKTERAQQLFLREVQAAAQLHHANIVIAYDAGEIDGRHFLAMEFVDGPNLETYVQTNGELPVGMACEIIFQAASGLQYAFERGMVHRDIKPANLLFQHEPGSKTMQVKILDFGLARLQQSEVAGATSARTILVKENTVMGTPDFLSPEQSRNLHDVDIRSDLYSLGCTFYYVLTGQVPFPGGTNVDKLLRQLKETPRAIEELRPDLPRPIAAILRKLMAKDPADRFQTPDELMEAVSPHAAPSVLKWPNAPEELDRITDEYPVLKVNQGDTEPKATSSTQVTDEESILEWVDVNRRQRQKIRRVMWIGAAIVLGGVLALCAVGLMTWVLTQ